MKAQTVMQLEPRKRGPAGAQKAKQNGLVPGVLYGFEGGSTPIRVPLVALRSAIAQGGEHHPFLAQLGNQTHTVLLRDIQRDIFTGVPIHFDLLPLAGDASIDVVLPIRFQGEKELASRGLLMHVELHSLTVHAQPSTLPDAIHVNVGDLAPGATVLVSDLRLPPGATAHEKPGVAVVHVGHTRVRQEATV